VGRYAEIYGRYEPVFHAYEHDTQLAAIAARTGSEIVTRIHSRLVTTTLAPRQLDRVIRLLLECLGHALGVVAALREVAPHAYPSDRVEVAITDVMHRTLFGLHPGVNAHPAAGPPPPVLDVGPAMAELLQQDDDRLDRKGSGNEVLNALIRAGHDVFVREGYHNTRVDDVVASASVSHGAFYRYFRNRDDLARILTARALRTIGATLAEMPDVVSHGSPSASAALRRWLRRYNTAHAEEAAMLSVWVDAALKDPTLRDEFARPLDWGRRRMSRYLRPRGFGDVDMDAVVMVALFGVFGSRRRGTAEVEAAAHVIERGLLGR
jgi:AcrR family transcriptional regulator